MPKREPLTIKVSEREARLIASVDGEWSRLRRTNGIANVIVAFAGVPGGPNDDEVTDAAVFALNCIAREWRKMEKGRK